MKKEFKNFDENAVTPQRLMSAIEKAVKYVKVDDATLKRWLEADKSSAVIDEICALLKKKVSKKLWEKLEI